MANELTRLIVPAGLGLAGFLGSMIWINRQVAPESYVGISQDVQTGTRIMPAALEQVRLPGRDAVRNRDLIPWADSGLVENTVALRPLRAGCLVLMSDVVEQRQPPPGFDVVYVELDRVAFRPDRIRPGGEVAFIVRDDGGESVPRIGPFEVFEPPVLKADDLGQAEAGEARVARPLSVLVPQEDPEGDGDRLRRAIADEDLRALEVVSRDGGASGVGG